MTAIFNDATTSSRAFTDTTRSQQISGTTEQSYLDLLSISGITAAKIGDMASKIANSGSNNDAVDPLQAVRDTAFCRADTRSPEQIRLDGVIRDKFGDTIADNLGNPSVLRESANRKKLEEGFLALSGDELWKVAKRMEELTNGEIYTRLTPGQAAGNLRDKRYEIELKTGPWNIVSDYYRLGQVYRRN